ncbi:MAG: hypothetical protein ACTSP6_00925 [Promethearchaeota archaeon]
MEKIVKKEYFLLALIKVKKSNSVLINSKLVRQFLFYGNIVYFTLLSMSIFLAMFFNLSSSPIWTRPVSDLGSSQFTPIPFMFDLSCIWAGAVIIPYYLSMKTRLALINRSKGEKYDMIEEKLIIYGSFIGIIGAFGCILVGIFSFDRSGPNKFYHSISTGLAFGGFIFSIILFSLYIVMSDTKIPNMFGDYGLIMPLGFLLLWVLFEVMVYEWLLLFSIVGFIIIHNLMVLK